MSNIAEQKQKRIYIYS